MTPTENMLRAELTPFYHPYMGAGTAVLVPMSGKIWAVVAKNAHNLGRQGLVYGGVKGRPTVGWVHTRLAALIIASYSVANEECTGERASTVAREIVRLHAAHTPTSGQLMERHCARMTTCACA